MTFNTSTIAEWRLANPNSRIDLRGASLYGADLCRADLFEADLYGADLRGADLYGAALYEADLRGADLRGADLRGAILDAVKGILPLPVPYEGFYVPYLQMKDGIVMFGAGCVFMPWDDFPTNTVAEFIEPLDDSIIELIEFCKKAKYINDWIANETPRKGD